MGEWIKKMWCIYKDPLEKEVATHSRILAWKIPWTEGPGRACPWGHKELDMTEHAHTHGHTQSHTHTHTHLMEYYSSIKKEETLAFVTTWLTLRTKWNKSERDKIPWSLSYVESKKWNHQTHGYREHTEKIGGCQRHGVGREWNGKGAKEYILPVIK